MKINEIKIGNLYRSSYKGVIDVYKEGTLKNFVGEIYKNDIFVAIGKKGYATYNNDIFLVKILYKNCIGWVLVFGAETYSRKIFDDVI